MRKLNAKIVKMENLKFYAGTQVNFSTTWVQDSHLTSQHQWNLQLHVEVSVTSTRLTLSPQALHSLLQDLRSHRLSPVRSSGREHDRPTVPTVPYTVLFLQKSGEDSR